MYKDKAKQKASNKDAAKRYRALKAKKQGKQADLPKIEAVESSTIDEVRHTHTKLPLKRHTVIPDVSLPVDDILDCNTNVGWTDILQLSRGRTDEIYQVWQHIQDDILLRLKRAAGYFKRTGIA